MPENQSLRGCIEAQSRCQRALFGHIDKKHDIVMAELGELSKKMAFAEGAASKSSGVNWSKVAAAIAMITAAIASGVAAAWAAISQSP